MTVHGFGKRGGVTRVFKKPKKSVRAPVTMLGGHIVPQNTSEEAIAQSPVEETPVEEKPVEQKKKSRAMKQLEIGTVNGLSKAASGKLSTAVTGALINTGAGTETVSSSFIDQSIFLPFKPADSGTNRNKAPVKYQF